MDEELLSHDRLRYMFDWVCTPHYLAALSGVNLMDLLAYARSPVGAPIPLEVQRQLHDAIEHIASKTNCLDWPLDVNG